jgi:hypothetical protein
LSKEDVAALAADFPDEAFQQGAAGKENLIYIEHAALRERLDQVIGMGQWCLIPIRRWEEQFIYQKEIWQNNRRTGQFEDVKGSHVYVDAILLIRGAYVASAIGEMTYYPDNHSQNYGDAVEGAETAALRRCCKRLGVGLQAWRKDWCEGWWTRKRKGPGLSNGIKPTQGTTSATKTPQTATSAPPSTAPEPKANAAFRLKALNNLKGAPGQPNRGLVEAYLRSKLWISGDQAPEAWSLEHVPATKESMSALQEDLQKFELSQREQNQQPA